MKNNTLKFMMVGLLMATFITNIHYAILGYSLGDKNSPGNVMAQDSTSSNGSNGGNSNSGGSDSNSSNLYFYNERIVDCYIPGNPSYKGSYINCVNGWGVCTPSNCTIN